MRYYKIEIRDADGGDVRRSWTSWSNGRNDPGALNIELDIPVFAFASPAGTGFLRIWGVSLQDIGQASDFNGKRISVFGGMQAGLPLANAQQSGLLVEGYVFQALGNWIGTSQTLDFMIQVGSGTDAQPKNLSLNWKKGDKLSSAIGSVLKTAFPDNKQDINISDKLVFSEDQVGYYSTMTQFAQFVKKISLSIVGGTDYAGVDIFQTENSFKVYDGTTKGTPRQIDFKDLIGQPTWLSPLTIQMKNVMRADLKVGDSIIYPSSAITTIGAAGASPRINSKSVFQGTFQISQIRHVGNFRQKDAASWVTVVDTFSTKAAA